MSSSGKKQKVSLTMAGKKNGITASNWCVLCISLVALCVQIAFYFDFHVDDAFISFRYAKNFARGFNFVYNRGEYVEGYTNFLWTFLIGVLQYVLGVERDVLMASKIIGIGCAILIVVLGFLLPGVMRIDGRWKIAYLRNSVPLLIAVTTAIPLYAVSGMETVFAAALVMVGFFFLVKNDGARLTGGMVFLILAALARFDMLMIYGFAFLYCLFAMSRRKGRQGIVVFVKQVAPSVIIYVLYTAWRVYTYKAIFPNTFYAKTGAFEHSFGMTLAFLQFYGFIFFMPLIVLRAIDSFRNRRFPVCLAFCVCCGFVMYLFLYGGDWMPCFRFMVPIMPLMIYLTVDSVLWFLKVLAVLISRYVKSIRLRKIAPLRFEIFVAFVVIMMIHLNLYGVVFQTEMKELSVSKIEELRRTTKRYLIDGKLMGHLAGEDHLVYTDLGGIPSYYSKAKFLEAYGLTEPEIAHDGFTYKEGESLFPDLPLLFHGKFYPEFIARKQPDYLLIVSLSSTDLVPTEYVPRAVFGWEYIKNYPELNLRNYRVGYVWSEEYPDHYVYFLEKRGIEKRPLGIEMDRIRVVYQN